MSLKKGMKKRLKDDISTESVVIKILAKNGEKQFPEIYGLFMTEINKNKKIPIKFTKVGLWKVLARLEKSGDIEKIISEKGQVYRILSKSKIFAEFNAISFSTFFEQTLLKFNTQLVSEFQNSNHKKTTLDGLLMFLGFRVLGAYLSSQQYEDTELKAHWLKSVLDLDKHGSMTVFFDSVINEEHRHLIGKELCANFPDNFDVLSNAFDIANDIKKITDEKGKGLESMLNVFVRDFNKEEEKKEAKN